MSQSKKKMDISGFNALSKSKIKKKESVDLQFRRKSIKGSIFESNIANNNTLN